MQIIRLNIFFIIWINFLFGKKFNVLKRVLIDVGVSAVNEVISKSEKAIVSLLAPTNQLSIPMRHAVKFDINLPAIFLFGIEVNCLNCDGEIEVDDFKGSEEDISFNVAIEFLPDCEIDHFFLVITLEGDSLFL